MMGSKWIDAKKKKPQSGVAVLVHLVVKQGGYEPEDYYDLAYWFNKRDSGGEAPHWSPFQIAHSGKNVRHWMPIPAPPRKEVS